jgi:3-oxoacyl-[acyl-carrier protein] reductase
MSEVVEAEQVTGQERPVSDQSLKGRTVLIAEGSRGLGFALASAFALHGADVVITYTASATRAEAQASQLRLHGGRVLAIKCDPGNPKCAEDLTEEVLRTFGRLDILVNAASVSWHGKTIDDPTINEAMMDHQWTVNVMAVVSLIRAAAKRLRFGGRIITLTHGTGSRSGYAVSPTTREPLPQ